MKKTTLYIIAVTFFVISCGGSFKAKPMTFLDGKFSIDKPLTWSKTKDLNDSADVQIKNALTNGYLIILSDPKSDFKKKLSVSSHAKLTLGILIKNLKNKKIETGPTSKKINGKNSIEYVVSGTFNNLKVKYLHTTIETKKHYHQVVCWTTASRYQKNLKSFQAMINSLKEL